MRPGARNWTLVSYIIHATTYHPYLMTAGLGDWNKLVFGIENCALAMRSAVITVCCECWWGDLGEVVLSLFKGQCLHDRGVGRSQRQHSRQQLECGLHLERSAVLQCLNCGEERSTVATCEHIDIVALRQIDIVILLVYRSVLSSVCRSLSQFLPW